MKIHFWNLPKERNYIMLNKELTNSILKTLERKKYPWKTRNKIKKGKISIKKLKEISKNEKINLELIEKNILWIGGNNGTGLSNPKFPINFNTRNGARFIAGIINDGTLTKNGKNSYGRLMYDNFDKSLRESIINDYLIIFGGRKKEIAFRNYERKKYLDFSSIIRDIIELVIEKKGPKCESNIKIPKFILENKKTMIGWIEQTIADEGEVKYYKNSYRRAITWRRSLDISEIVKQKLKKEINIKKLSKKEQELINLKKFNLIKSEEKILNLLGIKYILYNIGIYPTSKGKIRTKIQFTITQRKNLKNLRELIKIPSKSKDEKFTRMIKEFVRYKEPLKIKKIIINLGKNNKTFTSINLKQKMNYKTTNTAIKWIKIFEKQRLIKKVKKSMYGKCKYRQPAEYILSHI